MSSALLDQALGRLEEAGVSLEPATRVCVIGKLASGTAASFASWCEAQLKPRDATGFLLLLATGWVHTIEGAPTDVIFFLHRLASEKNVQDVKVIACQEDVRKRYFPHWCSKELSVPRANFADIEPGTFHTLLSDTAIAMLKMGKQFKVDNASPAAAGKLVEAWETHFADFMVSDVRVSQLLEGGAAEGVPSLADFLGIFEMPVEIVMGGDLIWPPERATVY